MTTNGERRGPFLSIGELRAAAAEMRVYDLLSIHAAGSGHPGGTLSIIDIVAALYLRVMNHDPSDPKWPLRDRVFWSGGHKAPALYVALGRAGYVPIEDTVLLRQLHSGFEGHPNWLKVPGVEISSGSLGQGLSVASGSALTARLEGRASRIYCLMGDGEQQEGSVWEAAMAAAHYKLDNLCAVVDKNRLQIDGLVEQVMNIDPLNAKYESFGWNVIEIDGHNMEQILDAFERAAAAKGRPTAIIANTIKGKGVSFMENQAGWHGVAPNRELFEKAMTEMQTPAVPREVIDRCLARAKEHGQRVSQETMAALPKFGRDYWWNTGDSMKVDMDPTRFGFGRGLEKAGEDPRVVTIHADISGSIKITDFEAKHPERNNRVFSVGIAEQNMMSLAGGMAKEGLIPVTGTYGVFAAGRAWDQIRTTICYSNVNVKIAGAHGGISVGADGATHQALEEIALMAALPNMHVEVPCDSVETEKATLACLLEVVGPAYLRYAREATPVVTKPDTPYKFGAANVIRYRGEAPKFLDAFQQCLAAGYQNEQEHASIVACGPMVPEAMRAAWLLKEDFGIETRVLNMHTVKPLDVAALVAAAADTGLIVTAEEHQVGGFGNIIAGAILRERRRFEQPLLFDMVGVADRFGLSGPPWDLMREFGLCAEHIAAKVKALYDRKHEITGKREKNTLVIGALECQRCHTRVPFDDFLTDWPASDELCFSCTRKSDAECPDCLTDRVLSNTGFVFICRDCRFPVSPC